MALESVLLLFCVHESFEANTEFLLLDLSCKAKCRDRGSTSRTSRACFRHAKRRDLMGIASQKSGVPVPRVETKEGGGNSPCKPSDWIRGKRRTKEEEAKKKKKKKKKEREVMWNFSGGSCFRGGPLGLAHRATLKKQEYRTVCMYREDGFKGDIVFPGMLFLRSFSSFIG